MKITWTSAALLLAPAAAAEPTKASAASSTTSTSPSCTASLITKLCDYKSPGPEFAVAIESKESCVEYCNAHQPCDFAIFVAGNPYTGTGTCWVYPGESFDPSLGNTDCANPVLSVYDKPTCAGTPTDPSACTATASPSAIASVCEYPAPDDDCWSSCYASTGASSCLKLCAEADSCSYAVFNPRNPSNSPYASGTCWVYTNGTYDAGAAGTCSGAPEQYVYKNPCPKPPPSVSSTSGSGSATAVSSATRDATHVADAAAGGSTAVANAAADKDNSAATKPFSLGATLAISLTILVWDLV